MRSSDVVVSKFASLLSSLLLILGSFFVVVPAQAQSSQDFRVEVRVANQSNKERSSAYWLAFDQVLSNEVETRVLLEPYQRDELLKNPSLYVKSFRYRKFNDGSDNSRLATRTVRQGTAPTAVIAVTFPKDIAAVIEQQLIPVVEEQETLVVAPVIALVAVEQQGEQFIIGGERGAKFQTRAMQLAAANNLQLQFPIFEPQELELINAADILSANIDRINNYAAKFQGNDLLTGALYRLSPTTWQSDWSYTSQGQPSQSFTLTTATLDEALVAAMNQISPGGGYLSTAYDDGSGAVFERSGIVVRVENINSLAAYDNVLATLRRIDPGVLTESLEDQAILFRATDQGAARLRDSLTTSRTFQALNTDQFAGPISFRYQGR